jgi:hypothetical protein
MKKIAYLLIFLGIALLGTWGAINFFGDNIVSEVKKSEAETIEVQKQVSPITPAIETVEVKRYTIHISNEGGEPEMDACANGFTNMTVYKNLGEHKLLSQHNHCGGDIIIPMEQDDHVIIEGDQEYVITELRETTKTSRTSEIKDMNGEVILQSCYYRENRMKFVALTPVEK